jgi:hypothetical protein
LMLHRNAGEPHARASPKNRAIFCGQDLIVNLKQIAYSVQYIRSGPPRNVGWSCPKHNMRPHAVSVPKSIKYLSMNMANGEEGYGKELI